MPPVGFEPTIPASARPQTYALERAATGIGVGRNKRFFCSAKNVDRLAGKPTLLFNCTRCFLPVGPCSRCVKLTIHLHVLPILRMSGNIPPLPIHLYGMHRDNLTLP
jgi:hypothetical protein